MFKCFLALVFLALTIQAQAASVNLTWTAPTTYEDGVPIEAGKVLKYEIWRSTSSDLSAPVRVVFDITEPTYTDTTVVPKHTYYYYVRAYFIDTLMSDNSNTASARIWPPYKITISAVEIVR